jgi:tRNA threonylcarbamoyl adenosine modification protein (Sua5/YciO/YrdC/YwlC family)
MMSSNILTVHPSNPQPRLLKQAVDTFRQGGVIAYPTDSAYALGCQLGDKLALERIRRLRNLTKQHNFTLVCQGLAELSRFAKVSNPVFRLLKHYTPGPYTFILSATASVPRQVLHPKRRTIGLRVPDHKVCQALLALLDEPILSSTLILPETDQPLVDPEDIQQACGAELDLIVAGGPCSLELTTVVNLVGHTPQVVRVGRGDPGPFQ